MDKYIEQIYGELNKNPKYRGLFHRMEKLENKILKTEYKDFVEEYTKIHMQMQSIALRQGLSYGIKIGKVL